MATRNSAKMFGEIKSYLDDAIKRLVTKSDIDSLRNFIEEQNGLMNDFTTKMSILDEKLNGSEAFIDKINDKRGRTGASIERSSKNSCSKGL